MYITTWGGGGGFLFCCFPPDSTWVPSCWRWNNDRPGIAQVEETRRDEENKAVTTRVRVRQNEESFKHTERTAVLNKTTYYWL